MAIEQSLAIVGFIVALALAIFVTYYSRRRRFRFPVVLALLLFLSVVTFIAQSLEGNAIAALFLWLSCIMGLALALDILTWRGRTLDEKLVAGSWIVVTSPGGILTNVYIFSVPASLGARVFSVSVLILVHVPILVALLAYFMGRKELSKRLVNLGYVRGVKDGV